MTCFDSAAGRLRKSSKWKKESARVRGEIEQMEAEQQTLEHRVNFATIDLKLAEEYKAELTTPAPSVAIQLRNALEIGKSTRLNSSHVSISYAVFCLKKKKECDDQSCFETETSS